MRERGDVWLYFLDKKQEQPSGEERAHKKQLRSVLQIFPFGDTRKCTYEELMIHYLEVNDLMDFQDCL